MLSLVSPKNDKSRNYYTLRKKRFCFLFLGIIFFLNPIFFKPIFKNIAKFAAMGRGPCDYPLNPALETYAGLVFQLFSRIWGTPHKQHEAEYWEFTPCAIAPSILQMQHGRQSSTNSCISAPSSTRVGVSLTFGIWEELRWSLLKICYDVSKCPIILEKKVFRGLLGLTSSLKIGILARVLMC